MSFRLREILRTKLGPEEEEEEEEELNFQYPLLNKTINHSITRYQKFKLHKI